jgi:stage II sporulation protein D
MIAANSLRTLLGPDTLRSTLFTVRRDTGGQFVMEGRGWGHGHGMCQTGAIALAARGAAWDVILLRYYAGARLTKMQTEEGEAEGGDGR